MKKVLEGVAAIDHGKTEVETALETLTLMSTVGTSNIAVDLPSKAIVYVRIVTRLGFFPIR